MADLGEPSLDLLPGVYGEFDSVEIINEPETKATVEPRTLIYKFEVGDRINIWSETGTTLLYNVESVNDNGRATFSGGGFTLTPGMTYYSSHPLIRSTADDFKSLFTTYEGQNQTANDNADHIADYTYTYASATCSSEGNTSFQYHHFCSFFLFTIALPDALTLKELTITSAVDNFFAVEGASDVTTGEFTPKKMASSMTLKLGEGDNGIAVTDKRLIAYLSVAPCAANDYIVRVTDSDGKIYTSPVISQGAVAAGKGVWFATSVFEGENPAVAKIGDTPYASLADAVTAAQSGDVITMIANDNISLIEAGSEVTIDKPLTITGAVDATTGMPKYTIYGSPDGALSNSSFNDLFIASATGLVTVSNVIFDGFGNQTSSVMGHSPVFVGSSNNEVLIDNVYIRNLNCEGIHINGGTFTVQNSSIDCAKTTDGVFTKGICVVNDATGSITGTTITGVACDDATNTSAAIELQGSGDITISGCTIQSSTIGVATTPVEDLTAGTSQVTISDCAIVADDYAVYSNGDKGALTIITSGTYSGLLIAGDNDEGFAISGGVFSDEVDPAFCAEDYIPADNIDPATMEDYPYTVAKAEVAMIGDVVYPSLAAAVAAVPTDGTQTTITMIDNHNVVGNAGVTIASGKNVILDLNGKTVCLIVTESKGSQLITNNGTLTITDSSADHNGKLTHSASDDLEVGTWPTNNYVTNVVTNCGTLNIEAGTIQSTANGSICYAVDNNSTSYDATLNVNGGYLTAAGTVIRQFCNSTTKQNVLNISGGTIETNGSAAVWTQLPGSSASSKKLATLNITGGVVRGNNYAWYDYSYGDSFEAVNYSISGGELYGYLYSYAVRDGILSDFVSGGLFSVPVGAYYVVDGYMSAPSVDHPGMYEIVPAEVYYYWYDDGQEVGEYYEFASPFVNDYLCDGEFITLLENVALTENIDCQLESGTFNLTLGDYSITKGSYSVSLKHGVSVNTDKQTSIFSAAEEGYIVKNTKNADNTYTYYLVEADLMITAANGTVSYKEWSNTVVSASGTYKLAKDITASARIAPGVLASDITLDLNGHTLTSTATDCAILLSRNGTASASKVFNLIDSSPEKGGKLMVNPDVNIGIQVSGSYNQVNIGEGVTVDGDCVAMLGTNQTLNVNGTINGGNDFAVATNGSTTKNVTININNGAVLTSNETAMYLPGKEGLIATVNGGTITGAKTGIELRAGQLVVNGGSITSTATDYSYTPNGNGTTTRGAAIAVVQHDTKLPIDAQILGGTLAGVKQIAVVDAQGNNLTDVSVKAKDNHIATTVIPAGFNWVSDGDGYVKLSAN